MRVKRSIKYVTAFVLSSGAELLRETGLIMDDPANGGMLIAFAQSALFSLSLGNSLMNRSMTVSTLFVVATPIGNLGDLSPRAVETLQQVSLVCAEDTRRTGQLCRQYGIRSPLQALHEHNEQRLLPQLVARLQQGQSVALVSDAGTPLISDPGYRLVQAAHQAHIRVSPVPGPSALIAALSVAGLPSDRFVFEGFLPVRAAARQQRLMRLMNEVRTVICYESAHRIQEALADCVAILGAQRQAVLAREMTKIYETVRSSTLAQLHQLCCTDPNQCKGEFVILIHGANDRAGEAQLVEGRRVFRLLVADLAPSIAARIAAEITGAPRKALYRQAMADDSDEMCHTEPG